MGLCIVWGWRGEGGGVSMGFFCFNMWSTIYFLMAVMSADKLHSVEMFNTNPGQSIQLILFGLI